ncbi:formate/nitrite transporter family protein [Haloterrigena salifodinae]|uniref:Formate/nitrite transporter family protein n=1 Tax=Haloterrigena salifodinae TaxID=2675099 RepID=A0A8T8DYS6_9EURY|nr:formate/nitrite transporter family protein [Haloterrigena salifodinae]QRV14734.1 formate/nitrite transporter family protein [Haloterrigena salifodinae]
MPIAPDPTEIFDRAVAEGERRLDQSLLELIATSFIAGFTIVFGIATLGIVDALVEPQFGGVAHIAGALTFAVGVVFLVVGRSELFNENFFDPAAKAVDQDDSWLLVPLLRLWIVTLVFNLVGGFLFTFVFAVDGVLPSGSAHALSRTAEEIVHRPVRGMFASAVIGGALVSLLSFLLQGINSVRSRITIAYIVGFLLALGPFDHVIVTAIHVFFGLLLDAPIEYGSLAETIVITVSGNFIGGIGLVTFTHIAQVVGVEA